ncbi:glycosyltransferase [Glycomyces sp. YM15]|uniref:glycosyltransferase n=1 Tax=Glycomyces sp. YM15 TaxID=2800446 RepID=UPI0019622C26|nr:glycosyltransferase [Glycomyces sp. YM15]
MPAPQWFGPEIPEKKRLSGARWTSRLFRGFHKEARKVIKRSSEDETELPAYRIALLQALVRWHELNAKPRPEPVAHDVDVLIVSDLSLPGGTTASNAADVCALREAGLTVALLHHPSYELDALRGVNAKILALAAEDDGVRLVRSRDRVHARLTIVRFPPCMTRLVDQRPEVASDRTVLVVNQAPYYYYGAEPQRRSWRVPEVHEQMTSWFGEHTWYCASPVIADLLTAHHADETAAIDISAECWHDITDPEHWATEAPERPRSGPIRIGRHSRDSKIKWPSSAADLLGCLPASEDFSVTVLGGAESPRRILGDLPANWTVHEFDALSVEAFLASIDVFVYHLADDGVEAFGRAPMEAMAAGVPCVLDPRLEPTFGDAAVYAAPEAVEQVVRELVADREAYAAQADRGLAKVRASFSSAHLVRLVQSLMPEPEPEPEPRRGLISRLRSRVGRAGGR